MGGAAAASSEEFLQRQFTHHFYSNSGEFTHDSVFLDHSRDDCLDGHNVASTNQHLQPFPTTHQAQTNTDVSTTHSPVTGESYRVCFKLDG